MVRARGDDTPGTNVSESLSDVVGQLRSELERLKERCRTKEARKPNKLADTVMTGALLGGGLKKPGTSNGGFNSSTGDNSKVAVNHHITLVDMMYYRT